MFHISFIVNTKQKSMRFTKNKGNLTIPLQKIKLQMKRAWKESNQITKQKTINKMSVSINSYFKCKWTKLLNQKIQRAEWIKKWTELYAAYKKLNSALRTHKETWKKIFQASENQNRARVAILISDKTDFKTKNNIRKAIKQRVFEYSERRCRGLNGVLQR